MGHLERAIYLACQTRKIYRVQICAILAHKNRIISIGYPQAKTSPLQYKYRKNPEAIFIHAEIDAIAKASRYQNDLSKYILYLARVDSAGSIKPIHPCIGCCKALSAFNISRVYHT